MQNPKAHFAHIFTHNLSFNNVNFHFGVECIFVMHSLAFDLGDSQLPCRVNSKNAPTIVMFN